MVIKNKDSLLKYLFLYRSFLFHFIKFKTTLTDSESLLIITALNIKSRYKRISFIINELCNQIDKYYINKNLCNFCNNKCIFHTKQNLNYKNGCCRNCIYKTNMGCSTKNFACKMFYCTYIKDNNKTLTYKDLNLLKVLTPLQRLILKIDYFSNLKEVTIDLFLGPIYSLFRIGFRTLKTIFNKYN